MIAAIYIEPDGCYANLAGVDAWCEARDARSYAGPYPVVAHPPCQRWGRMDHSGPSAPGTQMPGADGGCFSAPLRALWQFGGVLEHPCDSKAWTHFDLTKPMRHAGWVQTPGPLYKIAGIDPDLRRHGHWWTCYVEQGHYAHTSRKPTWLLTCGITRDKLPELDWTKGAKRLHPVALERYGYAKARRIGMTAMVGGKDKTKIRNATPVEFRDVLISIARTAHVAVAA